jgi:hypothetical protein
MSSAPWCVDKPLAMMAAMDDCTPTPTPDPLMDLLVASRRAAESAIALAMVTSLLPGVEIQYLDPMEIELPPPPPP